MTDEQRLRLRRFKVSMKRIATLMSNSMIGLRALAAGETDPQTKAAYTVMVEMAPALIAECPALAVEVEMDLRNDHLREEFTLRRGSWG